MGISTHRVTKHHSQSHVSQALFALLAADNDDERSKSARAALALGVSRREIAALLSVTPSAVSALLHRR